VRVSAIRSLEREIACGALMRGSSDLQFTPPDWSLALAPVGCSARTSTLHQAFWRSHAPPRSAMDEATLNQLLAGSDWAWHTAAAFAAAAAPAPPPTPPPAIGKLSPSGVVRIGDVPVGVLLDPPTAPAPTAVGGGAPQRFFFLWPFAWAYLVTTTTGGRAAVDGSGGEAEWAMVELVERSETALLSAWTRSVSDLARVLGQWTTACAAVAADPEQRARRQTMQAQELLVAASPAASGTPWTVLPALSPALRSIALLLATAGGQVEGDGSVFLPSAHAVSALAQLLHLECALLILCGHADACVPRLRRWAALFEAARARVQEASTALPEARLKRAGDLVRAVTGAAAAVRDAQVVVALVGLLGRGDGDRVAPAEVRAEVDHAFAAVSETIGDVPTPALETAHLVAWAAHRVDSAAAVARAYRPSAPPLVAVVSGDGAAATASAPQLSWSVSGGAGKESAATPAAPPPPAGMPRLAPHSLSTWAFTDPPPAIAAGPGTPALPPPTLARQVSHQLARLPSQHVIPATLPVAVTLTHAAAAAAVAKVIAPAPAAATGAGKDVGGPSGGEAVRTSVVEAKAGAGAGEGTAARGAAGGAGAASTGEPTGGGRGFSIQRGGFQRSDEWRAHAQRAAGKSNTAGLPASAQGQGVGGMCPSWHCRRPRACRRVPWTKPAAPRRRQQRIAP